MLGDPGGLLHVVRHDDDGDLVGQLRDGLLDPARRGGVEGRARLVHQQHVRADRERAGDAQALLLAAGEGATGRAQPALHLVPQPGPLQRVLDHLVLVHALDPGQFQPAGDVLVDGHRREGIGLLEDHPDPLADLRRAHPGVVDVALAEQHLARQRGAADHLVHPVEDPEVGGLAAAGRADQRGHAARGHRQRDPVEHLVVAEPGGDRPGLKPGRAVPADRRRALLRRQVQRCRLVQRAHVSVLPVAVRHQ